MKPQRPSDLFFFCTNSHVIQIHPTNLIEKRLSPATSNKRRINIDPGYITEAKVVLASTKDFSLFILKYLILMTTLVSDYNGAGGSLIQTDAKTAVFALI